MLFLRKYVQTKVYMVCVYTYYPKADCNCQKKSSEEVTMMTESNEMGKAICRVLWEIAQREKKKAVEEDEYGDALVATIFEELFKQAELSFS